MDVLNDIQSKDKYLKTLSEYTRKNYEELLIRIAENNCKAKTMIDIYNNMVDSYLTEKVKNLSFYKKNGSFLQFTKVEIHKPTIKKDGKDIPIYPEWCRKNSHTYNGDMYLIYNILIDDKIIKKDEKIYCGKIPVMTGSNRCYLENLSNDELIRLGECPSDCFGYFILKSERVIITQESVRYNFPIIYQDNNVIPILRITVPNPKTCTKIIEFTRGKFTNKIKMSLQSTRKNSKDIKNINIFVIYRVLGFSIDEATDMILDFFPSSLKEDAREKLNDTKLTANIIEDDIKYLSKKIQGYVYVENKRDDYEKVIKKVIIDDLFPNIYDEEEILFSKTSDEKANIVFHKKIKQLSFTIYKFILHLLDLYPFDDRDSFYVKRFESAGVKLGSLLLQYINKAIIEVTNKETPNTDLIFEKNLSKELQTSFYKKLEANYNKSNNWSVKSGFKGNSNNGENIVETKERSTPLKSMVVSGKTNIKADHRSRILTMRYVNPSQIDFSCVNHTPDGKYVGAVKYTCITCRYSKGTSDKEILNFINKDKSLDKSNEYILIVNGVLVYDDKYNFIRKDKNFKNRFIEERRKGKIYFETEIVLDESSKTIEIYSDSARPMAPYLIVNRKTNKLIIDEKVMWKEDINKLLSKGCIEYLSARERESEDIVVCESIEKFYNLQDVGGTGENFEDSKDKYSHCRIHPIQQVGLSASLCPMANMQLSPRTNFQCGMGQQALDSGHTNHEKRFDASYKILRDSQRAYTEPITYKLGHLDYKPNGRILMVALYNHNNNQEDAIFLNTNAKITYDSYETLKYNEKQTPSGCIDTYGKPDENDPKYNAIGSDGMPIVGKHVKEGDCLVGRIRKLSNGKLDFSHGFFTKKGETGYIVSVYITKDTGNQSLRVLVKLKQRRQYIVGDKLAKRYSQKGTIGEISTNERMLRVVDGPNKGLVPDAYFNTHGFPTRMTGNMLYEYIINKASTITGEVINFTTFNETEVIEKWRESRRILEENGMDPDGYERVELDGEVLDNKIVIAPMFYQALKHHVIDKIQVRSRGAIDAKTQTPYGGVRKGNAQKTGDGEHGALVAHGASNILLERTKILSDEFKLVLCHKCGSIPKCNPLNGNYYCDLCISRGDEYNIGVLETTYCFKLLTELLSVVNIDVKFETDIVENKIK